jgi:Domain of unknown function (DUF4249)
MNCKALLYFTTLLFFITSCIKKINPNIRNTAQKLVVDGGINTDTTIYKIRLTYSGSFSNTQSISLQTEDNAQVYVKDNNGVIINFVTIGNGYYSTINNNYVGAVGKNYQLFITLPNGEKYQSSAEKIANPVPVTSVDTIVKTNDYINFIKPSYAQVYISVKDPANDINYYRYSGVGWHPRKATGVTCGFSCIKGEYCLQYEEYNDLNINSDNGINGNQIIGQLCYKSPIYWYGLHYVDVKQYSITREAYLFWKKLKEQQTRTGSTLDPLPSAVEGNIYNVNNPNELALGFFEASSISHYKVILKALSLSPVFLSESASGFIKQGECYNIYPFAVDYVIIPNGWVGAPFKEF